MRKQKFTRAISLAVDPEMFTALKEISDVQNVSLAELIRYVLSDHLEQEKQKRRELQEVEEARAIRKAAAASSPNRNPESLDELIRQPEAEKAANQSIKE